MGGLNGYNLCVCLCVCVGGVVCCDFDIREVYLIYNYFSY